TGTTTSTVTLGGGSNSVVVDSLDFDVTADGLVTIAPDSGVDADLNYFDIATPALTATVATTLDVYGISSAGALTTTADVNAETLTYRGINLTLPAITTAESGDTTALTGILITAGTVTDGGGTETSVAIDVTDADIVTALSVGANEILGTGASINFDEFDVSGTTGAITINDGGDAGNISIEGTILDINSLDFVGTGTITSATNTNLAFNAQGTGDINITIGGGDFVFQQASTVSTSTGNLTLAPASGDNLVLTMAGDGFIDVALVTYLNNTGGIDVVRTGNFTGVAAQTALDLNIAPSLTLTEPASGTFIWYGGNIDMSGIAVTAGAGTSTLAALRLVANADADVGTNYALFVDAGTSRFDGSLAFTGSTSGTLTFAFAATITDYTVTWPAAQASGTQVLQNDGAGALSWATLASTLALHNITAATGTSTIANANNAIVWNWGTLTTQTGMNFGGGTAMTTGSVFALGGATYVHTAAETGNLSSITLTDASSNTTGNSVTNGLSVSSTVNTTGGGTKDINALFVAAPTFTGCVTGACIWNGLKVTTTAPTSQITVNGLNIVGATAPASSTINALNIGNVTAGAGTENAISVGTGWDAAIASAGEAVIIATGDALQTAIAGNPGTPADGMVWYDSTATKYKIRESGTIKVLCNTTDAACGAGGGAAWSALTVPAGNLSLAMDADTTTFDWISTGALSGWTMTLANNSTSATT
ncbi:MAG: hypothetical protein AABX74_02035, partial [Nanoarchaeota archaeon]